MKPSPVKLVLIEDQMLLRQSLAASLRSRLPITEIFEFGGVDEVLAAPETWRTADVALVDIRLNQENSFELTTVLRKQAPRLRLIWMTSVDEGVLMEEAFAADLPGFVHKEDELDVLVEAINTVMKGGRYYSDSITRRRKNRNDPLHFSRILSSREQEVLKVIGSGLSNTEAGAFLGLSPGTIQAHRRNIMSKLDLHTAAELQAYALRRGFVDINGIK